MEFVVRQYRAADFDRLWQIDQACFPPGIAYSQMELSGFIMRRNAISLVAEFANHRKEGPHIPPQDHKAPDGSHVKETDASESADPGVNPIVGFTVAQPYRKTGRIVTLDIIPRARRYGLGSRLMRECEGRLRQRGCTEVYLETAVDNEAALKLYRKLGYEILRTLPAYYHAHGLDALLMGKRL